MLILLATFNFTYTTVTCQNPYEILVGCNHFWKRHSFFRGGDFLQQSRIPLQWWWMFQIRWISYSWV